MNFVGEQEVVSLFIWTQHKLDGRRRQAKEIRVTGPVVVEERDLEVDVKAEGQGNRNYTERAPKNLKMTTMQQHFTICATRTPFPPVK